MMSRAGSVPTEPEAGDVVAAAELFRALSNPLRVTVLRLLSEPHTVGSLVALTGVSQPLVSQHLRVLRSADLVVVERHGREAIYKVSDEHITHVVEDAISHARETQGR